MLFRETKDAGSRAGKAAAIRAGQGSAPEWPSSLCVRTSRKTALRPERCLVPASKGFVGGSALWSGLEKITSCRIYMGSNENRKFTVRCGSCMGWRGLWVRLGEVW